MNLFKPKTFKGKLSVLIVMTTGLALLIAIIAFTLNDNISVKKNLQSRLDTQAKIISDTSVTALLFDDRKASEEILSSLEADPSITQAAIYNAAGSLYASYTNGSDLTLADSYTAVEFHTDNSFEKLQSPIQYNGKEIGYIVIVASKDELTQRVIYFGTTAIFILLIALLLSFFITRRLQNEILLPISSLTQLASKVRDEKNYDLRVKIPAKDELGNLGAMFNEMLSKVQERDNNLETLVGERTQQLEEKNNELSIEVNERKAMLKRLERSEESFKSSFDQSAISMALIADDQTILQVNNALCLMLGYHEE